MNTKRLAENLVQKAGLVIEIYSFEVDAYMNAPFFSAVAYVVMATISKRSWNKASILTSFSISKRNEPAYSDIWKIEVKRMH